MNATEERQDEFAWLAEEIASVQTKGYFVAGGSITNSGVEWGGPLPDSYLRFAHRFGTAKLYRQHVGYGIGVLVPPRPTVTKTGERLLKIGHYLDRPAYFKVDLLPEDSKGPVYESQAGGLVRAGDGFALWLRAKSVAIRSKIGKQKWSAIVAGPSPFSPAELRVVAARRSYHWRCAGFDGDRILVEVTNASTLTLPFLTVGVRAEGHDFEGRIWLPVRDVGPGAKTLVGHDCYSKQLPRDAVRLFDLGDPSPEEREWFWEFRSL